MFNADRQTIDKRDTTKNTGAKYPLYHCGQGAGDKQYKYVVIQLKYAENSLYTVGRKKHTKILLCISSANVDRF